MSVRAQFDALFPDGTSRAAHSAGLEGALRETTIRSILWRVYLEILPSQVDQETWTAAMKTTRDRYAELTAEFVINPDDDDDTDPMLDNPLMASDDTDSKWSRFFEDEEIQKEIRNDITRTYPDLEFFRRENTQTLLTRVLFIWVKLHPELGYRQGMNELLAPIALVMSKEYGAESEGDDWVLSLLDPQYMEHDAFAMFSKVMDGMMELYITESSGNTSSALRSQMNALGGRGNDGNLSVLRCRRVHQLLEKKDSELYSHIAKVHQVEPQLYVLRWLRLVFTREFHIDDVMIIWDAVLADSSTMRLVDYIAVSMLLYVKANVLAMDDTCAVMARLMKYPPVENIHVIIQNALAVANKSPPKPSMSYGHMPRPAKSQQPLPPVPEVSSDPLSAIAATVVQGTRDLLDLPDMGNPAAPASETNATGFTPRPGMTDTGFTPRPHGDSHSNAAARLFESPESSPKGAGGFDSPDVDGFASAGDMTHRKVTASFGPGVTPALSPKSTALPPVPELPTVVPAPEEVAVPVEPHKARAEMVQLVEQNQIPSKVLELFDGAANWKDEQQRNHGREVAERLDQAVSAFGEYISDTQQIAEQNPEMHAALTKATEALSQLEVLKSCLILGSDLQPTSPTQCVKQVHL